jgi:hypothetical protein
LPADVPKHIADELARAQPIYQLLWDHFTGKHWLGLDANNRHKWPLRINYSQAASFIHASTWAGDMPDTSDPVVKPVVKIGDRGNNAKWGDQATGAFQKV